MTERRPVDPSPNVIATIRLAPPESQPPDDLVPYVAPRRLGEVIADWELTPDAIAFGDRDVMQRYREWRGRWVAEWILDPRTSVVQLIAIADARRTGQPVPNEVGELLALALVEGEAGGIPVDRVARLRADLEHLRDEIRSGGGEGFGFVDATPGSTRVGLARAWSPSAGEETLASTRRLAAVMDPEHGLGVELYDDDGELTRRITGIESVDVVGDQLVVFNTSEQVELHLEDSRPLSWLVPGATRWRVRRVPQVLVWARTISGLIECCELAARRGTPILLTTTRRTV